MKYFFLNYIGYSTDYTEYESTAICKGERLDLKLFQHQIALESRTTRACRITNWKEVDFDFYNENRDLDPVLREAEFQNKCQWAERARGARRAKVKYPEYNPRIDWSKKPTAFEEAIKRYASKA